MILFSFFTSMFCLLFIDVVYRFFMRSFSGDGGFDLWMTYLWEHLCARMLVRFLMRIWPTRFEYVILFHSTIEILKAWANRVKVDDIFKF